ncbi:MAG TPA: TrbG/VirB9 family P-type conjugative transfer protein [Steroidobacteraceae bacterium]|jgi:type IV secretion system protein VirB9|nr:TrbG/VirB9 family P-type conjugative transfer protein [Steroidobacteraceae bacterium]
MSNHSRQFGPTVARSVALLTACLHVAVCSAAVVPAAAGADGRIRVADYDPGQVYVLQGRVGYQIDLQFDPEETFVGLAAGDIEGLTFVAQGSHLFLKPRAQGVMTNLTVLTSQRQYQFEYSVQLAASTAATAAMYVVRFRYPRAVAAAAAADAAAKDLEQHLQEGPQNRSHNTDYWFCGTDLLRPAAAWDDGVQTHLLFGQRSEQPAIFVRNDDGTESLLNFSIESGEVIIHRIARRLILRRGALTGCIVNKGFSGTGERLPSGTIAPDVRRTSRRAP